MSGFLNVLIAEGGSVPSANFNVGSTAGGAASASCTVHSDGTLTFTGNTSSASSNWWNLFGAVSGNTYWVKFHTTSGTAWTTGGITDNVLNATTTNNTVGWATGSSIVSHVTASFYNDAIGTVLIGTILLDVSLN